MKDLNKDMLGIVDNILADVFSTEKLTELKAEVKKTADKEVEENVSGVPVNAQSAISSKDRADLVNLYNQLRKSIDTSLFNIDFQQDRIYITRILDSQKGFDYTPYQKAISEEVEAEFDYNPYLNSIMNYMTEQGAKIEPFPEIEIKDDPEQAENFFGKTAYYSPEEKKVVLYIHGRLPKDVCRSFAHEMIHHIQNLEGRLGNITTSNTNEDDYLQQIEDEAYKWGNRYFRNWEDNVKY
jgi:ribosomal protein L11 methylase PrmA